MCYFLVLLLTNSVKGAGLRGVGLYESNTFEGISVSMAGGGYLNIAAQDQAFDGHATQNHLKFETDDLSSQTISVALPPLSGKLTF